MSNHRMVLQCGNWLACGLAQLGETLLDWSRQRNCCLDCGRSRFYGAPCQ